MCLLNKNGETINYACSLKSKKAKLSEQRSKKRGIEKESDNKGENKKEEIKKYKIYGKKH